MIVSVDTEDFEAFKLLKQYLNIKGIFSCDEATLNVLKSMKKIGRYNRKIGIGIGSSEGRNFAHPWLRVG